MTFDELALVLPIDHFLNTEICFSLHEKVMKRFLSNIYYVVYPEIVAALVTLQFDKVNQSRRPAILFSNLCQFYFGLYLWSW